MKLDTLLKQRDRELAADLLVRFVHSPARVEPAEWCRNIELRTTTIKSAFSLRGREYLRDVINDIADDELHFQTCCWGTGCAKTTKNIAQMLFAMANDPGAMLYVVPAQEGQGGARELNNTCIIATIKATECFRGKIPTGKDRHNFSGLKCIFGGNTLHLVGANSPGQLAGPRRRIVWLDESDKFKERVGREAAADYLANERTKQVPRSKLIRGSSPSLDEVGIWPHLLNSDLRRRYLPCPFCGKDFVLVQSSQYTVLPLRRDDGACIPFAALRWDAEAKRKDGSWDLDRVIRSTRFECPHCGGHVRDHHREAMDAKGSWIATRMNIIGHRGYHLPSFYAPHVNFESSWGGIAKKFLEAHESANGMRGYINSELAEVDASQEHTQLAVEISGGNFSQADWTATMSCDFQKLYPYIWFVIARWSSFKLQPPFNLANAGLPPALKAKCEALSGNSAKTAVAEVLRFDPRTGGTPLLDFLLEKNISGDNLARLYSETCHGDTMELGRWLYRELGQVMPKGGDCEIVCAGHCELSGEDAWEELRDLQKQYHVGEGLRVWGIHPNRAVLVDAGYMEEHNPEVLRKCFESNTDQGRWQWYDPQTKRFGATRLHTSTRPAPMDSWIPYRGLPVGVPGKFRSGDGIGRNWKFSPDDPFKGLAEADRCAIGVLEAASELYFHRWLDIREAQKTTREQIDRASRGNLWALASSLELYPSKFTLEMFQAQLNAKGRNTDGKIWHRGTGGGGKRRHPDHLNDCCVNMYPHAEALGFFSDLAVTVPRKIFLTGKHPRDSAG